MEKLFLENSKWQSNLTSKIFLGKNKNNFATKPKNQNG
jgi:hypothetical protein